MRKKIAIYPGSFDPPTNGHLDILHRALKLFDEIIIAVTSVAPKNQLFTIQQRVLLLKKVTGGIKHVTVDEFRGLLVDYTHRKKAVAIIRGLRAISDFEYEFQMALMNRKLSSTWPGGNRFETVYLMPDEKYTYISSTLVKEVASLGGNIKSFVPRPVEIDLLKKFS